MRRSVIGPFILILLGGLFLLNNIRPDLDLFGLLSNYWPFLLIAWGVLRLVEVLVLATAGRPYPAKGLSGGEVLLIVLICSFGWTFFSVRRHIPKFRVGPHTMELFGEAYDYPVSLERPVAEKATLVFNNLRGNVRITGAEIKSIKISGRKTIRAYNKSDADKASQQTPVEVISEGARWMVKTNEERLSDEQRVTADLDVSVPRGSSIECRGRRGDFDVTGVDGTVEISSDNAGVRLNKIGGDVKVDLKASDIIRAVEVKGGVQISGRGNDIELENILGPVTINGAFAGNLEFRNFSKPFHMESRNTNFRVEKLPGRISMDLGSLTATNLVGPIHLTTKSRDIKFEQFTQSLELDLERGDIELRPKTQPLPKIDAHCRSVGNIELVLPGSARFELAASTERGETRNEFGPAIKTESADRSATMKAKNGGGPMITVSTARGTVTVRKE